MKPFELTRLSSSGECCMCELDVEKLRRRNTALACEVQLGTETITRKLAPVLLGRSIYFADVYTGTLYDEHGRCVTSENLRLLEVIENA